MEEWITRNMNLSIKRLMAFGLENNEAMWNTRIRQKRVNKFFEMQ